MKKINYLMDFGTEEQQEETDPKKRKQIAGKMRRNQRRNKEFKYVTGNVGKGKNNPLRCVNIVENQKVMKVLLNREEIETTVLDYNRSHYKKVMLSPA